MHKHGKLLALALLLILSLCNCTSVKTARRVLETDGITEIELTGYDALGCGQGDNYATGFKGKKNGRAVKGVVCEGITKGATIRYY